MSMFPHTVTVYNVGRDVDLSTMEETLINHITVLRGVLLDASKGTNVTKSGLEGADALLNRFGDWARDNLPDLGDAVRPLRMEPTAQSSKMAAYEDGFEDYMIPMKLTYEIV